MFLARKKWRTTLRNERTANLLMQRTSDVPTNRATAHSLLPDLASFLMMVSTFFPLSQAEARRALYFFAVKRSPALASYCEVLPKRRFV
jgi:hypothetical protein